MKETLHCLDQCQNKKGGLKYWTIVGQMCPSYAISKRHPVNVYKLIVGDSLWAGNIKDEKLRISPPQTVSENISLHSGI